MVTDDPIMPKAPRGAMRGRVARMFEVAMEQNLANIERLLAEGAPRESLLDVGCDDGENTLRWAAAARATSPHGIEIVGGRAALARQRGVRVEAADVMDGLPYEDRRFDAVVSNQVIEHVVDTDLFVAEIRRVLRPGGVAVVSTENLASWHNIGALALGWQPFSLTNVSGQELGIGNPLALHRGQAPIVRSWQHQRVFGYRGLIELFAAHGFTAVRALGAGYYPFPARLARLDRRHAAFLSVSARRPV